ncbi:MAG: hypothetical protein KBA02_08105 [Paludibacteraceae bacterium]|nr:hypothetical protein [Paludibacteraceae bacterium]
MPKIVYKKIYKCNDCPYFRFEHETEFQSDGTHEDSGWYACGFTDKILIREIDITTVEENDNNLSIPDWCPLEDYDLWHAAIDAIK